MSKKGNSYLAAKVAAMIFASDASGGSPVWIAYNRERRRFDAEPTSRPGRARTQIGPYTLADSLWQIAQDVETAVAALKRQAGMRA